MMASTKELSRVQVVVSRISLISAVNGSVDELPHNVPEQLVVVGVVTVVLGVIGVGGTIVDPP